MKLNTLHILLLMLAGCFAACTDDITVPITDDGTEMVYTLRLAIEDVPQSRGVNSVSIGGLKTQWCYGDAVTLSNTDGTKNYKFTIETATGKNIGDPVEGSVEFTYKGSKITNWDSFSGTITYAADATKDEKIYADYTSQTTQSVVSTSPRSINCSKYALQTANDNTDHLKCIERLSAEINNMNLQSTYNTIALRRNCSILKIVLDDIYYDLYGGSVLFVEGLKPVSSGTANNVLAMVLGYGIVSDKNSSNKDPDTYYYTSIRANDPQDPKTDKNKDPFFVVSENKRPFTGYAERDDDHKLVVYMPIFEEREVRDGEKISIYLRDSWAMDWYAWETAPLKPFKIKLGSVYTLDFTKKAGGRYVYESLAAIYLGQPHLYGIFGSKNLGAEKPTDVGNYYMLGNRNPIICGESYPNPQGQETPYFYYNYSDGKDYLKYNNPGGSIGLSLEFINPESYGSGNTNLTRVKIISEMDLTDLWKDYLPQLDNDFPSFIGTWTLPLNATTAQFQSMTSTLLPTIVGQDGQETTDGTNPAGVKLRCKRTGHSIYLPVSGILEPSLIDVNLHCITLDAVAQMKEGTEKYAMFTGQYLYLTPAADGKDVKLTEYVCKAGEPVDNGKGEILASKERMYIALTDAVPIRPALWERELEEILKYIPGWTSPTTP